MTRTKRTWLALFMIGAWGLPAGLARGSSSARAEATPMLLAGAPRKHHKKGKKAGKKAKKKTKKVASLPKQ
jgi:hypothetical protein